VRLVGGGAMDFLYSIIDVFLHLDKHLDQVMLEYGTWTYLILVLIIFCETGLVVTPFLPGDSLLFAAGAIAGRGTLDPWLLFGLLTTAAIVGDNVNYWVGRFLGPRVLTNENSRIFKKAYLDKTHAYFEKYGGKTIIIARFVPIVRTFAPFVTGVGAMTYTKFLAYDICGGVIWVGTCVGAGYLFGGNAFVKEHFELVVLGIIFVSLLPAMIEFVRVRQARRRVAAPLPGGGSEPDGKA
jgi:membrane-associated protein